MKIEYRKLFLKNLKKLKKESVYQKIFEVTFTKLPQANSLKDIPNIKAMKGYPNRYRIRVGNYRIGIEVLDEKIDVIRVIHRRNFYRYFP